MLPSANYGRTGLRVSRLCFGTGQFQESRFNLTPEQGAVLLQHAYLLGVTFFDLAIGYGTHPHMGLALREIPRASVVIQSKTDAKTAAEARTEIEQIIRELGSDYVDVLLLHGVSSAEDFAEREEALAELVRAKREGYVRFVGASTHIYTGSALASCVADPRIEVILALANKGGFGLVGGDYPTHLAMLRQARVAGKAVCGMKVLGEGNLADEAEEHMRYCFTIPEIDAVDLGMASLAHVDMAVAIARGEPVSAELVAAARAGAKGEWVGEFIRGYK